jgi:hypothetical protein
VDDDFKFIGKAKVNANTYDVIAASIYFGGLDGLITTPTQITFEMKNDHINGGFIRPKEITGNYK